MDNSLLEAFIEKYNKDKEEFNRRFENLNYKLQNIDKKFDDFDKGMQKVNDRLGDIEGMQNIIFGQLGGFKHKLDNVKVYLSTLETKLNECKTLSIQGEKVIDGELFLLKIKLQKVKPIVNWENDNILSSKFKEIEQKVMELEESIDKKEV